ncbi:AraC family transcriptional regulator [Aminipila terrae]|uniref:Helix-turn-helix domain-containing protein n=1 Tax=Aminipila terrae TaxID=2697030 RepID=A0A6P1MAC5_9FIRM|nr:helix-turn-helix domain-containing protein [Aminipila terrae]QHI71570.1 helix-turn-helix domain-containing protein [Aminipila terrae]
MIDSKEMIVACINYIERNIGEKISLDDISGEIGVSKYYMHRMFKSLTGESIIEYVQSRKLSSSINELVNSNMRMIDIAMDYGFDHEQSYIRAFKKRFGYTPFKVRSEQVSINITEKININDILSVNNSITYRPFYVFRQKFYIAGSQYKIFSRSGDNMANFYGRQFFYHDKNRIENAIKDKVYYGYTDWSGHKDGYIYYVPSVEVPDLSSLQEGITGISIPAHKYVVFRFVGFFRPDDIKGRQVGRLLVHLYRNWITNSGFQSAAKFRFEYIDTSLSNDNYCELDIYQPIKERNCVVNE